MPAPPPDSPSSISSSGHSDGLGRRAIVFDREDGAMLEALHVRPELSAFENVLRARIERLAAFEDERFARIRGVDRDPDTGELTVISEFVPGSRLSDLLDVAQERAQEGITPGVDVALGYLVEALPAISALHSAAGVTHGAIAPARTVLTPAGQVVFLDTAYGQVLERLQFSRRRLWTEFLVAMPPSAGPPRFDAAADIGQVALNAVMLVLGRSLRDFEYPDALPSLMMEVVEVAQIRGTRDFAAGVQRFLQRALPLPGRTLYGSSDEAASDIREIARQEIGLALCHQALIEFVAETTEGLALLPATAADQDAADYTGADEDAADYAAVDHVAGDATGAEDHDSEIERPVLLDEAIGAGTAQAAVESLEPIAPAEDEVEEFARSLADVLSATAPPLEHSELTTDGVDGDAASSVADPAIGAPALSEPAMPVEVPEPVAVEAHVQGDLETVSAEPPSAHSGSAEWIESEPTPPAFAPGEAAPVEPIVGEPAPVESPRRKRKRSVRARIDKLRSFALGRSFGGGSQRGTSPPPLVSPDRAAAYEDDELGSATRAIGFAPASVPMPATTVAPAPVQPTFAPAALAPPATSIPMPQFAQPPASSPYSGQSTTIWTAPPVPPEPRAPAVNPVPSPPAAAPLKLIQPAALVIPPPTLIKLKSDAPMAARARVEPRGPVFEREPYSVLPLESSGSETPRAFPMRLAAAVLIIVAAGVAAGRAYLPGRRNAAPQETTAVDRQVTASPKLPPVSPANAGHIDIQTQPPGAHVLLDGEPAGETPLKLDVTPGRHVLTFVTASGSVKRNVRVDSGKSISLDVALFSGWVAIFAPVALEISENGKSIGSTEDGRIMLAPGRHDLTLTSRSLGYVGKHTVEIEPGELKSVNLEPKGTVNFNAIPWAEVWIDGKKAGETPMANAQVPLGLREIVFKNPDYGERRMTTTVRADSAGALSVDFTTK